MTMADFKPKHFNWRTDGGVAVVSLARPERKEKIERFLGWVGLPGTGDDNLEYTVQSMKAVASPCWRRNGFPGNRPLSSPSCSWEFPVRRLPVRTAPRVGALALPARRHARSV